MNLALGAWTLRGESHRSTHGIGGTFGAAAGLDAQRMRWMLDYAAQQASGIASWGRDPDHIEKAFVFGGMPARDLTAPVLGAEKAARLIETCFGIEALADLRPLCPLLQPG